MSLWGWFQNVLGVWWKRPSITITKSLTLTGGEKKMETPINTMILNRTDFTDNSTIGDLYVDGNWVCFTLEPTCRKQEGKFLAMPQGKYEVVMYESAKLKANVLVWLSRGEAVSPILKAGRVPLLLNVPGHDFVEMHPGNSPSDTKMCILPGQAKDVDYVMESRAAFETVASLVEEKLKAGKFYIGITGGTPNV
jgi:hypothetical protein